MRIKWFRSKRLRGYSTGTSGMTLTEVVIATVILSMGVLAFTGAMGNITKSIYLTKAKTIASNLAQEKIESLKNVSYYRLLVTTAATTSTEPGITPFQYDQSYYPPETLTVGQITFERRILIQKVTEASGNLTVNNWWDNDSGLKLISSHIVWLEGNTWRKMSLTNLRENPNRKTIDATFTGKATAGGVDLPDATVVILQNLLLKDKTNATGDYTIRLSAGNYSLKASKPGYFPSFVDDSLTSGQTKTINFPLTAMGTGGTSGLAYLLNHLVISKVCAAAESDDQLEFVEIYNPTSSAFEMYTGTGVPVFLLRFVKTSDNSVNWINPSGTTKYIRTVIPAHGYFLFASSNSVNGVSADAYYSDASLISNIPEDRIPTNESGGIGFIAAEDGKYGEIIDAIGWGQGAFGPYGPANAREQGGFQMPVGNGFLIQQAIQRLAYSSSTALTMAIAPMVGQHANFGNSYDTNNNATDWILHDDFFNDVPRNALETLEPQSGTPAIGAMTFIDDGLSTYALAQANPTPGIFTINNIATGTWNILASSGGWVYTNENVVVTQGVTTQLGPIFLSSPATGGFISGKVVDDAGSALAGIDTDISGVPAETHSNGYYRYQMAIGTYTVIANPNNTNSLYTTGEATGVFVNAGQVTMVPDITLFQGGAIKGFMTTNGTDPLPSIPLIAQTDPGGAEVGSSISDTQGNFTFSNLAVGSYIITPQLEVGESANPTLINNSVVSGVTVFAGTITVSNAFGKLKGSLTSNSRPITTGALIAAVPQPSTISDPPTPLDSALRNGTTCYYLASSDSTGDYELSLRGNTTYYVVAWYSTINGLTATTTPRTGTFYLATGGSATLNFSW